MNKLNCVARIWKDLELKNTKSGMSVCDLPLAIDNGSNKEGKRDTLFIQATVFNKTADNCVKYLAKGSLISCDVTIKNRNYEDSNGNKKYDYQFMAQDVRFLNSQKKDTEEIKKNQDEAYVEFGEQIEIEDSDLPF